MYIKICAVMHYVCIIIFCFCASSCDKLFVYVKHTWQWSSIYLILITVLKFFSVMSEFDFSSSVSYDLSELILIFWFAAQETFLIIITVENGS